MSAIYTMHARRPEIGGTGGIGEAPTLPDDAEVLGRSHEVQLPLLVTGQKFE